MDETAAYEPINAYGFSKKEAELLFKKHFEFNADVSLSIIRPSVLYGPSNPNNTGIYRAVDNNIFRLIDGISAKRFAIVGSGKTIKTTAYVKNFVDSILFISEHTQNYELYVYADNPPMQMIDLVRLIRLQLNKKGDGLKVPFTITRFAAVIFDWLSSLTKYITI